jgi:crotonobetainyl-CoA:carnitine CoA-transferase CaiB-like acyl-CoA transferase
LTQNSVTHWNEVLTSVGVPCAPINSIAQLLDHPHTRASGIIVDYEHQTAGPLKGVGHPVLINGAERRAGRPPPVLGQHTDDVLGEMGLSPEVIGELRRARVIG